MKTITNCFLYIAILVAAGLLNVLCLGINICERQWWLVALDAVAVVICVWAIRLNYKRAKRLEEYMKKDIQTVMNLQLFDLMRHAFEKHPDAFSNGFGTNPKTKEDEVEEDNGTPV